MFFFTVATSKIKLITSCIYQYFTRLILVYHKIFLFVMKTDNVFYIYFSLMHVKARQENILCLSRKRIREKKKHVIVSNLVFCMCYNEIFYAKSLFIH